MKTVFHAANVIEAQLVADLLAHADIRAHVIGGYLGGGIGELPAGEGVQVWVADGDLDIARRLIDEAHLLQEEPALRLEALPALQASWERAWSPWAGADGGLPLMERLLDAWSEPQRSYHTLQHLAECILRVEPHLAGARFPQELETALWFHDAVYDARASDNEQRSADWAARELAAIGQPIEIIERVRRLILATCHDALATDPAEQLLVDVDLAILGAAPERFDEYEAQVREEYAWLPEWVFRRRRREILAGFLARPRLFQTPDLHAALEHRAKSNLRRSLARLAPWWQRHLFA